MTGNAIRVEVTDRFGTVAHILEPPELRDRDRQILAELAGQLLTRLAALPGIVSEDHARNVAVADLTRLIADREAYEREAERRGVLPL